MARLTTCTLIGRLIGLIILAILALFDERRAKVGFNGMMNEQRKNTIYDNNTASDDGDGHTAPRKNTMYDNNTASDDGDGHTANSTRVFDLNATLADNYARDSIGPAVTTSRDSVFYNPLENCAITSHFRLVIPAQDTEPWILQTFDSRGEKTVGGDELYIMWKAKNGDQAVAWAHDRQDGKYELEFIQPPIRRIQKKQPGPTLLGRVTVFYDYSCGIGSLAPPLKDNYTRAGEVQMLFIQKDVPRPPIREFQEPNTDYAIDLERYDFVYFFGDSMLQQLSRRQKTDIYWNEEMFYKENVKQSLTTTQDVEDMLQKLRDWHGSNLTAAATSGQSIAVVTGSSLWDLLNGHVDPGYQKHAAACRSFVTKFRREFPHVDLYWKSPSALHFHRLRMLRQNPGTLLQERAEYMSQALPYQMYLLQKALMEELQVPFLDLYEAYYLSGPWTRRFDARHYRDEISSLLLSYYWSGLNLTGAHERLTG
jgi:hypothetical protein